MYNHKITRLAYKPIFFIMFVSGICMGSLLGLFFILIDRTAASILAGAFIALVLGIFSGLLGLLYTGIFNLLAPAMGGIPLEIQPSSAAKDNKENSLQTEC